MLSYQMNESCCVKIGEELEVTLVKVKSRYRDYNVFLY